MNYIFDHEKLRVYQAALSFIKWLQPILKKIPKGVTEHDQLDRASTSIALNIAEGNGKFRKPDRCRYFDIAHASALECSAGLDTAVAKGILAPEDVESGKNQLRDIVNMMMGMIKSNSPDRVYEEQLDYGNEAMQNEEN